MKTRVKLNLKYVSWKMLKMNQYKYITSDTVAKKLRQLSTTKLNGPDNLPNWLLKTYADIIAPVVTDILNCSFQTCEVSKAWKMADVPPIPKQ